MSRAIYGQGCRDVSTRDGAGASDIENYKQITHFCKKLLMSLKSQLIKDV